MDKYQLTCAHCGQKSEECPDIPGPYPKELLGWGVLLVVRGPYHHFCPECCSDLLNMGFRLNKCEGDKGACYCKEVRNGEERQESGTETD